MRLDLYAEGGYSGGGITENGGNISGPLLLAGNPSQTLEAVPKQYVDAYYNSINAGNLVAGTLPAARLPNFTGDLQSSPGTTQLTLNNSGVSAGEYSKVTVNSKGIVTGGSNIGDSDIPFGINWSKINQGTLPSSLSGYGITNGVSVSGATMLGFLTISNEPTLGNHIATKQYVDSLVSGGGIAVGDILRKPYSTTPSGFLKCNGAELLKADYANLYAVIGDSFKHETVPGNGRPWEQQYQINATQSGDLSPWVAETGVLPASMYYSSVAVTKNRVYLVGLWAGGYSGGVYTAPINTDGSIGTWTTGNTLPSTMAITTLIVTKNRLYAISGYSDNSSSVPYVYTAAINGDGTLGAWGNGPTLPAGTGFSVSFVTKNRVYVVGGTNGASSTNIVYTATINSDGTLNAWSTGTSFPVNITAAAVFITKNRVFICGGTQNGYSNNAIYTASINVDGTIGTWVLNNVHLPESCTSPQYFIVKNTAYIVGGYNASNVTTSNRMYYASIKSDGTLGEFAASPNALPWNMWGGETFVVKNKVYICAGQIGGGGSASNVIMSASLVGGSNDYSSYYTEDTTNYLTPGAGKPWQQQYQINTTQSTDITGWTSASSNLPGQLGNSQAVVTKNRVYLLGGNVSGTSVSTVYTASINADGTLGNWATGTILPSAINASQVIAFRNKVYIIGGSTANVYSADINADGTLGTWVLGTALPVIAGYGTAVITRNRIYIIGCYINGSYSGVTYTAPINSDGTLGTWTTGTTIPVAYCTGGVAITKNKIYYCGGWNGGLSNTVYYATINSDGFISSWSVHSTMPGGLLASQCIVTKNRLYMFGGFNGNTSTTSAVYTAPIDDNGNLGTWTTGSSISIAIGYSASVITKNRIYLMGGNVSGSNVTTSAVITASISSGMNDYSSYFDGSQLGEVPLNNSDKFLLPDLSADEPFGSYSYIKY